jgi:hypothetical protein
VACLDAGEQADRTVAPIRSWQETFPAHAPVLAEVVAEPAATADAARRLEACSGLLAAEGIHPDVRVLLGDDPVARLEGHADRLAGPVYVATSARYTDGRLHWHSTTRDLLHRARRPVLVVPARPSSLAQPADDATDVLVAGGSGPFGPRWSESSSRS